MKVQRNNKGNVLMLWFVAVLFFSLSSTIAEATMAQNKLYKKAFPEAKFQKCTSCHTSKIPKKGEGLDSLNAYGRKAMEVNVVPTKETYKEVGSVEDFEAQNKTGDAKGDDAEAVKACPQMYKECAKQLQECGQELENCEKGKNEE